MTTTTKILLVEDDGVFLKIISDILSERGYTVMEAGTVREALSKIDEADVVVLDMKLPNGTGREVASALRDDVPVIVSTGLPDEALRQLPLAECLNKPYSATQLLDAVARAVRAHEAIADLAQFADGPSH